MARGALHRTARRRLLGALGGAALLAAAGHAAHAQTAAPEQGLTRIVFGSNWYAQAEHGGFYQAVADGTYAKHGLKVEIRMGGPQINAMQLLLAGKYDIAMGDDLQTLKAIEQDLPLVTIATTFQRSPTVLLSHPGPTKLDELRERPIFIGQTSETTYWPWLKSTFGFSDKYRKPYSTIQPFLADKQSVTQGYLASEPFMVTRAGVTPKIFLLGEYGYPPYAQTIVTTRTTLKNKPDVLRRFVEASAEGWRNYLRDPAAGNGLIRHDNPQMEQDVLTYGVAAMRQHNLVTGGDAATRGLLTMTDARWLATFQFMLQNRLIKPSVDPKRAYTTEIVDQVKVLP
jgi:NitT/TauT family transport system substrate-binding protein